MAIRLRSATLFAVALGAVVLCFSSAAFACGGCFAPPTASGASPGVVQTAERVLFVHDAVHVLTRVWVEVRYSGPANDFAWVLPLPAKPKVGIGSSWLFDRLDLATAPRLVTTAGADENCADENCADYVARHGGNDGGSSDAGAPPRASSAAYNDGGCGGGYGGESAGYSVSGAAAGEWGGRGQIADSTATSAQSAVAGVELLEHDQTGPYDYDIIESKDPDALAQWLKSNGYAVPPQALPIIAAHVAKKHVFLAVRLKSGAEVEVHKLRRVEYLK